MVGTEDLAGVLGQAISEANETLRRRTRQHPELAGMATTLVALLWSGTEGMLANIGDSRAYMLRDRRRPGSRLVQVSEDHTYRQLVADAAAVPHLPEMLTRFLDGRHDGRSPDLIAVQLQPGDRILLCSEGLSSYVPHELIRAALGGDRNPEDAAGQLVTLALKHGGHDNVTVVVVDVRD